MARNGTTQDLESLNHNIFKIDLESLEAQTLEQRIELAVATTLQAEPFDPATGCGSFSCNGYFPAS